MADIELVIKIPECKYKAICEGVEASKRYGVVGMYPNIHKAIYNGTPLPKGHGDLIDRGELKTHFIGTEQGTDLEVYLEPTIINAPPIIKADKEDE